MTSSDFSAEERYVVFGFVRNQMHADCSRILPSALIIIIIQYFRSYFEWNTDGDESFSFSMNNTFVSYFDVVGNSGIWTAKNIVDAKKHSSIEWEVTLKTMPSSICFAIGFVEQSIMMLDFWKTKVWLGNESKEQSIVIYSVCTKFEIRKAMKRLEVKHEKALTKNVVIEDRFELRFDLISNQCSFYYNGEFMAIMCHSLPKNAVLVPAMCCMSHHDFQTTKWRVQYRKDSEQQKR